MKDILNLTFINNHSNPQDLLKGSFGIEWEGLRVNKRGKLSLRPHPEIFGNKLTNPYITTDFSESQIEIITPAFDTIDESFEFFSFMADLVNTALDDDEYLWFQSLPCILPEADRIPIAKYEGEELAEESMEYRRGLAKKYGLRKQLISGIHFNFSFKEELIEKLYQNIPNNANLSYKEFKNEVYLKISRNYIRHVWFIIYLTGCTVAAHDSFTEECTSLMEKNDNQGGVYSLNGPSFRNASCGYKNLEHLYPNYDSINGFTSDVQSFIDQGIISQAKELYSQIRLKPKNPRDMLASLNDDGIQYVEIRTLDINPFYKCGLIKKDMDFLHLFLIYSLIKDETSYENWQDEALYNEESTAEFAYDENMKLLKDGEEISIKEWGLNVLDEMEHMCKTLGIDDKGVINLMRERIIDPSITYGKRLIKLIEEEGYINSQLTLSKNNKLTSKYLVEKTDLLNESKFKDYIPIALQGCCK